MSNPFDQYANPSRAMSGSTDGMATPGLSRGTAGMSLDGSRPQSPGYSQMASGLKTPTSHGFMPLPLGTPGAGQPTTAMTVGGSVGQNQGIGFGLREPPKMRKAMSKLGNEGVAPPNTAGSGQMTPDGSQHLQGDYVGTATPPQQQQQSSGHSSSPRGTLAVKLISARGLAVSHSGIQPEPYVVMQFEQNEFISRSPHTGSSHTSVPFTTAQAQPMVPASPVPGNLTRSASGLGVGTISRAFAEAMGRGKQRREGEGVSTPKAEEPQGGSWLGKPGPGDPVWKEEVSLCV